MNKMKEQIEDIASDPTELSKRQRWQVAHLFGFRCAHPECRVRTARQSDDLINGSGVLGVAIRVDDPEHAGEEPSAVWLCEDHARIAKRAPSRLPPKMLLEWVQTARERGATQIGCHPTSDLRAMELFAEGFRTAAFDASWKSASLDDIDQAVCEALAVLRSGVSRERNDTVADTLVAYDEIHDPDWSQKLQVVVRLLEAVRLRVRITEEHRGVGLLSGVETGRLRSWLEQTRLEMLGIMSAMLVEGGLESLPAVSERIWQDGGFWSRLGF